MRVPIAASSRQAICCYGIGVMCYVFAKLGVDCRERLNDSDSLLKYTYFYFLQKMID